MYFQVILTGGTAKMPRLQQAIKEALPSSELLSNLTADEVMAVGDARFRESWSYGNDPFPPKG